MRVTDGPLILGIETSCDETGVGIVRGHTLLADAVASSVEEHARFGGRGAPEVASRAHLEGDKYATIERACDTAGIAITRCRCHRGDQRGPGLAGALLVGVAAAKALGDRPRQADLRRQPPRRSGRAPRRCSPPRRPAGCGHGRCRHRSRRTRSRCRGSAARQSPAHCAAYPKSCPSDGVGHGPLGPSLAAFGRYRPKARCLTSRWVTLTAGAMKEGHHVALVVRRRSAMGHNLASSRGRVMRRIVVVVSEPCVRHVGDAAGGR